MKYLALLAALGLAGCGADGAPIKPSASAGEIIGGTATMDITTNG